MLDLLKHPNESDSNKKEQEVRYMRLSSYISITSAGVMQSWFLYSAPGALDFAGFMKNSTEEPLNQVLDNGIDSNFQQNIKKAGQ